MLAIITGFLSLLNFVSFSLKFRSLFFDLCCISTGTTNSELLAAIIHTSLTVWWSSPCLLWQLLCRICEQFLITEILTGFLCCIYCFISPGLNNKMAGQHSAFAGLFKCWIVAIFICNLQDQEASVFQHSVILFLSIPLVPFLYILWFVDA